MNLVHFLGPQTEVPNLHRSLRYWKYMITILETKIRKPFGGLGGFALKAIPTVNCHLFGIIIDRATSRGQYNVKALLSHFQYSASAGYDTAENI